MNTQITKFKNAIKIVRQWMKQTDTQEPCRMYVIEIDQIPTFACHTTADVIHYLEFNWPVGTKVDWNVKP